MIENVIFPKEKMIFSLFKETLIKYGIIIFGITVIFVFQINYLIIATRNVPIMDYWRYINDFGEKIMLGNISLMDYWTSYGGHRSPLQLGLFFLNIRFFGYNTQIEIFGGLLFQLLSSLCIINVFMKKNINKKKYDLKIQLLSLSFLLAVFSLNQWEILTLEFSLAFMIRIFCYIGIFILLNHCLFDMNSYKDHIIIISFLIINIICFIGQAYFIAFIGAISIITFVHFLINYSKDKLIYLKNYLCLYSAAIIGTIIYLRNSGYISQINGINKISIGIFLLNFIKGTLLMLGSSLCQNISTSHYKLGILLGMLIALLYIFALVLYFKKKKYLKTYLPFLLIIYCFINIIIIVYTRSFRFNLSYLTSSRYTCETTLGLIGIFWIFAEEILNSKKLLGYFNNIKLFSVYFSFSIIVVGLISVAYVENDIGFYRGKNFENIRDIIPFADSMTDEELKWNLFQTEPKLLRSGISLLKKHNLNVFNTNYNSVMFIGFYVNDTKKERFPCFINGNASIKVVNKTANHLKLVGYCPENMPKNYLTVIINDKESVSVEIIPGDSYNIELDFENLFENITINLITEKTYIPKNEGWNDDIRELGAYILSWELSE
jgi:hypothetical protein